MPRITFSDLTLKGTPFRIFADNNESMFEVISDQAGGAVINTYDGEFTTQPVAFRFYFDGTFFAYKLKTNQLEIGDVSDLTGVGSSSGIKLNTEEAILNRSASSLAPAKLMFFKNRAGGSISNGDQLAFFEFYGRFGSTDYLAGRIGCRSDGAPGSNDMPGRIDFQTSADGTATPVTRYSITNGGRHLFGQPVDDGSNAMQLNGSLRAVSNIGAGVSPSVRLHVQGSSDSDSLLRVQNSGNTVQATFGVQTTGTTLGYGGTLSAHSFSMRTSGTERTRWDTGGNLFHNFSAYSWTALTLPGGTVSSWTGFGNGVAEDGPDGTTAPILVFIKRRSGGTTANGDTAGSIHFDAHNGTNIQRGAFIRAVINATPTSSSMPMNVRIGTTPSGSNTTRDIIEFQSTGDIATMAQGRYLNNGGTTQDTRMLFYGGSGSPTKAASFNFTNVWDSQGSFTIQRRTSADAFEATLFAINLSTARVFVGNSGSIGYKGFNVVNATNNEGALLLAGSAGNAGDGGQLTFGTYSSTANTVGGAAIASYNNWGGESNGEDGYLIFKTNKRTGSNTYTGLTERFRVHHDGVTTTGQYLTGQAGSSSVAVLKQANADGSSLEIFSYLTKAAPRFQISVGGTNVLNGLASGLNLPVGATVPNGALFNIASGGAATFAAGTVATINAPLSFNNPTTPALITASQNNYAPATPLGAIVRLSANAGLNITGMVKTYNGERVTLVNIGSNAITLTHQDAASTAANRFFCPGSANYTLAVNAGVDCWYDTTSSGWRLISK